MGAPATQISSDCHRKSLDFEVGVGDRLGTLGCPGQNTYSQYKIPSKNQPLMCGRLATFSHLVPCGRPKVSLPAPCGTRVFFIFRPPSVSLTRVAITYACLLATTVRLWKYNLSLPLARVAGLTSRCAHPRRCAYNFRMLTQSCHDPSDRVRETVKWHRPSSTSLAQKMAADRDRTEDRESNQDYQNTNAA
jgi:hypothetical protein